MKDFIRRWFSLAPKAQRKVVIVKREASRFRLHEWRTNEALVSLARKTLDNNDFRIMMDVVRNENPINSVLIDAGMEERAITQARCEGYSLALNNLDSLGYFEQHREIGQATYGAVSQHPEDEEQV